MKQAYKTLICLFIYISLIAAFTILVDWRQAKVEGQLCNPVKPNILTSPDVYVTQGKHCTPNSPLGLESMREPKLPYQDFCLITEFGGDGNPGDKNDGVELVVARAISDGSHWDVQGNSCNGGWSMYVQAVCASWNPGTGN